MKRVLIGLAAALALGSGAARAQDAAQVQRGQQVFTAWCAPCHGGKRVGNRWALPATASLEVKYKGEKPALLEQRTDLPAGALKLFIRGGSQSMPAFRKVEVSDPDIDAIAAYLQSTSAKGR